MCITGIPFINNIKSPRRSLRIFDLRGKTGCCTIWYLLCPAAISRLSYIFKLTSFPKWTSSSGLSLLIETVFPLINVFNLMGERRAFICSSICCSSPSVKGKLFNRSIPRLLSNNIFAQLSNKSFSVGYFITSFSHPLFESSFISASSKSASYLKVIFCNSFLFSIILM